MTRGAAKGLAAFAILLAIGGLLALPEQPADVCLSADGRLDLCYCEALHDGLVRQPVNALSSLAFPAAGVAILWRDASGAPKAPHARLRLVWALTCILLGPASIVFHATFRIVPGLLDTLGITFWLSLFTAYHVGRAYGWKERRILFTFGGTTAMLFSASAVSLVVAPGSNGPHYITEYGGGLPAVIAPFLAYVRHGFPGWRSERWLAASIGSFVVAFATYGRSITGADWCSPDSPMQGHAVWHILCALSTWLAWNHASRTTPRAA